MNATGAVTDRSYIAVNHVFTNTGVLTVTLQVTNGSTTEVATTTVRVFDGAAVGGISDEQREMLYTWLRAQTNAEKQKCLLDFLPYPGASPELEKIVTPEVLKTFPTSAENKKVQWLINGQWWFDNAAEVEKRWNEFKLLQ